jgi:hypothetical protein
MSSELKAFAPTELALRVVACTQTTELIEEPRFVKEENITPKKEIP